MRHRTTPDITIKRFLYNDGEDHFGDVVTIPITEKSRRKFTLMSEDSITLSFTLSSATKLAIGDFVDDELFGRYYLTKEYLPKYNNTTGGYDYEVTFDAQYMLWRNWLCCLVATDAEDETKRMESNWRLTDKLSAHAGQVCANLSVLGQGQWSTQITAENAGEAKYIAYNGISLLDALNAIANTYECEWWVTTEDNTIHFGKCEGSGDPMGFTLGDNVETMDIADNRNTFANRIYVFGGTQNIPVDYDRTLEFSATAQGNDTFKDENRPIKIDMLGGRERVTLAFGAPSESGGVITAVTGNSSNHLGYGGTIDADFDIAVHFNLSNVTCRCVVAITRTGSTFRTIIDETTDASYQFKRSVNFSEVVGGGSSYAVSVTITLTPASGTLSVTSSTITGSVAAEANAQSLAATLSFNGSTYAVTFSGDYDDMVFAFDDTVPTGFTTGSKYTLSPLSIDIPLHYYNENYTNGTLSSVGERRLHLPDASYPGRYIDRDNNANSTEKTVEAAVVFEDVYPRVELKVTEVTTKIVRDEITHEDGSKTYENAAVYLFKVSLTDDSSFVFNTRYLLDGEKLMGHFHAPAGATSGNLLSGMSFELGFDYANQQYRIVRNEDYGARLPNGILKPQVGDRLVLSGWNPKAMNDLGLVAAAETELATKGAAYASALNDGQFTFTCRMMSGWPFLLITDLPMHTSADEPIEEAGGGWFYVLNGYTSYRLPIEGAKVTINHAALPSGSKTSRIIGYEMKLDMPWESPSYTVGETQAYSRLAKIEKEITKLS